MSNGTKIDLSGVDLTDFMIPVTLLQLQHPGVSMELTPEDRGRTENPVLGNNTSNHGEVVCHTQTKQIGLTHSENIVSGANASVRANIWPGNIFDQSSVLNGQYRSLSLERNPERPLKIQLIGVFPGESAGKTVHEVDSVTVQDAINDLLEEAVPNTTEAMMDFELESIYSEDHLKVHLGANYRDLTRKVTSEFDLSQESKTNKMLVRFYQRYYIISVVPNTGLPAEVDVDDLVFVSNVSYGRMLLFLFESTESVKEMEFALRAKFRSLTRKGGVEVDTKQEQILNRMRFKSIAIGGSATDAADALTGGGDDTGSNTNAIEKYINAGSQFSIESPGSPMSYAIHYIQRDGTDGGVANTFMSTVYPERSCFRTRGRFRVENFKLHCDRSKNDGNDWEEFYGDFEIRAFVEDSSGERKPHGRGELRLGEGNRITLQGKGENVSDLPIEPVEFAVDNFHNVKERTYVEVVVHLREWDRGIKKNDDLGERTARVRVTETGPNTNPFEGGLHEVGPFTKGRTQAHVSFDVTPLK